MSKFYYTVRAGRIPGIYESWEACKAQVNGFPAAVFKKFKSREEAEEFLRGGENICRVEAEEVLYQGGSLSNNTSMRQSLSLSNSRKDRLEDFTNERNLELPNLSDIQTDCLAYVDGSFNIATRVYGYGVLLILEDGTKYPFQGSGNDAELAAMRNVAGELYGSMRAITEAEKLGLKSITIFYDYMGIECWASGTWKRNKDGTKAYYEFIQEKKKSLDIHFQKVKAHSGVEYNELVDKLAKEAAGV